MKESRFTVVIEEKLKKRIKMLAVSKGLTMKIIVAQSLKNFLEKA